MGGCVSGQRDINDTHPNIFTVNNIDDEGNSLGNGHLEVTDTGQLIFHQKGKDVVMWPLKSLRRYGAEADIFSFESGRKCDTGPGIYAFRCDRAERLLNLLQERVRSGSLASGLVSRSTSERPTQEGGNQDNNFVLTSSRSNHSLTRQLSAEPGAAVTVTGAAAVAHQVRLSSLPNNGGEGGTTHPPEYANVNCNDGVLAVEDSKGYLVPNTPDRGNFNNNNNNDVFDEMPREYENVCPTSVPPAAVPDHVLLSSINGGVHIPPMLPPKPPVPQANATAIGSQDESSNTSATSAITGAMAAAEDSALPPPEEADEPRQINYIAVDFKSTASPASPLSKLPPPPSSPSPATSNQPPSELRGAYCTIDIDRTKALSTTAKQQSQRVADPAGAAAASDSPVGVRKTRHNSTLQELAQVASHVGGVGKRNSLID